MNEITEQARKQLYEGWTALGPLRDSIQALLREVERRDDFLMRHGYRECDIPACNCGSWHGGSAEARLREIYDLLGERANGMSAHEAVKKLLSEVDD